MSRAPRFCSLLLIGILSVLLSSSTADARAVLTTDPRYSHWPQDHGPTSTAGSVLHSWVKGWWEKTPQPTPTLKHDKAEKAALSDDRGKTRVKGKGPGGLKSMPHPAKSAGGIEVPGIPAQARPVNRPPVALRFDDLLDENGYVRMDRPANPWHVAHRVREELNPVDDGYFSENGGEGSSGESSRPGSPYYDEANEPSRPATPKPMGASEAPGTSRGPAAASRPATPSIDKAAGVGRGARVPAIGGSRPPTGPGGGTPSAAGGRVAAGQAASIFRDTVVNTGAAAEGTVAAIIGSIGMLIP